MEQRAGELVALSQKTEELRKEIIALLSTASQLKNEQTRLHTQQDHLIETIQRKERELETAGILRNDLSQTAGNKRSTLEQIAEEIGYLDITKAEILSSCEQL